jgi:hypothetical protein
MKTKSRAILFRIGGLGDLFVALPAISLVRRSLPGFSLSLAGRPEYGGLLEQARLVDEVLSFEDARMAVLFAGGGPSGPGVDEKSKISTRRTAPLDGFELAVGWLNRPGHWPADDWWAGQGIERALFMPYENGAAVPMSRFFFDRTRDSLNAYGIKFRVAGIASSAGAVEASAGSRDFAADATDTSAFDPAASDPGRLFDDCARLPLPGDLRKKALADLRLRELGKSEKRLVVHPGSGGRAKRWPLPSFVEVIRRAASLGLEGVLVTGEAEADLETPLRAIALPGGWTRVSRLPAGTLAGLLAGSTHYLGNDSGPAHLAAACGASVLALFREDSLPAWRPFGKTRLIAAPSMPEIPLDSVLAALDGFFAS